MSVSCVNELCNVYVQQCESNVLLVFIQVNEVQLTIVGPHQTGGGCATDDEYACLAETGEAKFRIKLSQV